ncbi:MAG: cysteine protease StiP family protein [Clostridiales Family XIII bacterium]|nr:cysteine protease StiP family protein [Clostridiales Family XIII bacterium]
MNSTFLPSDVTLLLKDVSGMLEPMSTSGREAQIQSGVHYSEMLPLEYSPSQEYIRTYENALNEFAGITAAAVAAVSDKLFRLKSGNIVLVSLARSGTPIGVLIKRYIKYKYGVDAPHYSVSIIRGKGIDHNAVRFLLERHAPEHIQFVDGWIGKGAILRELKAALTKYPQISSELAVLADPAQVTSLYGTREDFLIASACLNSTACGLISRTILRPDLIELNDYHGAVFFGELRSYDRTYEFINQIEQSFKNGNYRVSENEETAVSGLEETRQIAERFGVKNINFVKPSVGETTRVLLRRVPDIILVKPDCDPRYISHLLTLVKEKNVQVIEYSLINYNACGIIKSLNADI